MIRISPTAASGLSLSTYSVSLPHGDGIDLGKARPVSVSSNLDGSSTVTAWNKSIEGHQVTTTVDISQAKYDVLKSIVDHATVFEWVAMFFNRTFTVVIDVLSERPVQRWGANYWRCSVRFTIVSDVRNI